MTIKIIDNIAKKTLLVIPDSCCEGCEHLSGKSNACARGALYGLTRCIRTPKPVKRFIKERKKYDDRM